MSEGESDLTKCANNGSCLESENRRPAQWGLDEGGWLSAGGGGGGWRGKATEADFSMSHLAVCQPSVGTRSGRPGLTCSHRETDRRQLVNISVGSNPKTADVQKDLQGERLGYGFIRSTSTTDHQPDGVVVMTKQCMIVVVRTCEALQEHKAPGAVQYSDTF